MNWLRSAAFAFGLAGLLPAPSLAQAPQAPPYSVLGGTLSLSAGTGTGTSSRTALPSVNSQYKAITVYNSGSNDGFFSLGSSSVVATTTPESTPPNTMTVKVKAQTFLTVWIGSATHIAVITASLTTTIEVYQASGPVQFGQVGAPGGATPSGPAGGDLTGTYPNPTLAWVSRSAAQTLNIGAGGTLGALAFVTPGTGVATALGVNIGTAGSAVVNGGALGTPSSGTLTSATGLPISTGLTGAGTGVLAALAVNVGSAGAFVTFNGALGTPSSGVGTNLTGTASGLTAGNVTGAGVASATSLALGGATIGTDALGVTGTATFSGAVTASAFIPSGSTVPTNGIYLSAANTVAFATNSNFRASFTTSAFQNSSSSGWSLPYAAASSTAPSFVPNRTATDAGIGAQAAGNVSVIASATERARFAVNAASVSDVLLPGTLFTGGTGTTTFPQILVQPTGTTAATTWSTSGTIIGANVVSGFAGNFLDFHVAGAASVFSVSSTGAVTAGGGNVTLSATGTVNAVQYAFFSSSRIQNTSDGIITLNNNSQNGFTRLNFGGTANTFPALRRTTTALNVRLADDSADGGLTAGLFTTTGVVTMTLTTDATLTTRTVCQNTADSTLKFGSGALGICLGTSSARYKHDIADLDVGLRQISALRPIKYHLNSEQGDPSKTYYGFTAEEGGEILPALMGRDTKARPNTFDYLGVVPVLVKAMQELQAEVARLKTR